MELLGLCFIIGMFTPVVVVGLAVTLYEGVKTMIKKAKKVVC